MKISKVIIVSCITFLLLSCKEKEVVDYVTQSEFNTLSQKEIHLKNEIDDLKILLAQQKSINSEINLRLSDFVTKDEIHLINERISEIEKIDFSLMKSNDESIKKIQLSQQKTPKEKVLITPPKKRKVKNKTVKNKLNVAVSSVNRWGRGYVAVIYTRKEGYKTVSVHQFIGDGWEVFKIKPGLVMFLHKTGQRVSIAI